MLRNRVYLGENDYICSVLLKDGTRHRLLHHRITTSKINEPITNAIRALRHVRRRFYDAFEVCGEPW